MSLTDGKWTEFQIDAEVDACESVARVVEAHNEIYGKMEYAQKCMAELQKENEELKAKIKFLNKAALHWQQAMIDLEINRGSKSE